MDIVYTAITGRKDVLYPPEVTTYGTRYICFTDSVEQANGWEIVRLDGDGLVTPCMVAKSIKCNPHKVLPEHEWSLWVDGNYRLKRTIESFKDEAENDITVFKHPKRDTIYQEADTLIGKRKLKIDKNRIIRQVLRYENEGFDGYELAECGVILRKNGSLATSFNDMWWDEICEETVRDQLSFPYISWKTGIDYGFFEGMISRRNDLRRHNG